MFGFRGGAAKAVPATVDICARNLRLSILVEPSINLRENRLVYLARDIGKAKIAAGIPKSKLLMVEPHQGQQRSVQVVGVHRPSTAFTPSSSVAP